MHGAKAKPSCRIELRSSSRGANRNKVFRLKKALYGLKQSPRAWFGRFSKVMIANGYKQSQGDHILFIKHSISGGVTTLIMYVDGIIVIENGEKEKNTLKKCLAKEFEIKDLGKLKYFLGIWWLGLSKAFSFLNKNMLLIFSRKQV